MNNIRRIGGAETIDLYGGRGRTIARAAAAASIATRPTARRTPALGRFAKMAVRALRRLPPPPPVRSVSGRAEGSKTF